MIAIILESNCVIIYCQLSLRYVAMIICDMLVRSGCDMLIENSSSIVDAKGQISVRGNTKVTAVTAPQNPCVHLPPVAQRLQKNIICWIH